MGERKGSRTNQVSDDNRKNDAKFQDKRIAADNEFSDSEDEGEGGRRDQRSFKGRKRPRLEKDKEKDGKVEEDKKDEIKTEVKGRRTAGSGGGGVKSTAIVI